MSAHVEVGGNVFGHLVIGDHNVVVSGDQSVVTIIKPEERPQPVIRATIGRLPRQVAAPVGRDRELSRLDNAVAPGSVVQVYGAAGLGKSTLIRFAARRFAGQGARVVFVSAAGRDVGDVAQDVFEACYHAPGYRPSRVELQRLMTGIDIRLLVDDLEAGPDQLDVLLDELPDATLLYTGAERSLSRGGQAFALEGLAEEPGLALLAHALDRPLCDEELPLAREIWQATKGSPLLLVRAAGANRGLAETSRPLRAVDLGELLPRIFARLSSTAREIISVLSFAGAAGIADGLLRQIITEPATVAAAVDELAALSVILPSEQGVQLAPGIVEVLGDDLVPGPAELGRVVARLRNWAALPGVPPQEIADHTTLLTAIIDATVDAGHPESGARLAKAVAPVVACSLRLDSWGRILARGKAAAERAGDQKILAYLTHEDGIRSLVSGKQVAAIAAITAAIEIWRHLGDTTHAAVAQHAHALAGAAHGTGAVHGAAAVHTATTAHAVGAAHGAGAVHAAGQAAARTTLRTAVRSVAKTVAAKATVGVAVVAVTAAGTTAVYRAVAKPSPHKAPVVVAAPVAAPTIAYATRISVVLRTGTGRPRVVGSVQPNEDVKPVWSQDGKQFAWLTGQTLNLVNAGGGPIRSWPCSSCTAGFQGDRLVATEAAIGSDGLPVGIPQLHIFPADGSASTLEPITGISPEATDTDFILMAATTPGTVVVAYGDAGGSNGGGTQLLYRVDGSGRATLYGSKAGLDESSPGQIFGGLSMATSDAAGDRLSFVTSQRGGACGYGQRTYLLNTTTGAVTVPAIPSGGGPDGFTTQGLWFDRSGAAYASFTPNPSDCANSAAPPSSFPANVTPIVCEAEGGRWVRVGEGVIQAG